MREYGIDPVRIGLTLAFEIGRGVAWRGIPARYRTDSLRPWSIRHHVRATLPKTISFIDLRRNRDWAVIVDVGWQLAMDS